ncbi:MULTISPECIES: hypothetical protein [unclassified Mesorhizobium]|uniref:hypothetical protein n=1 Tax=unclassified Mesorhizobium TaxID=325217 RepID=UPI001674EF59|nr:MULTISPECIES: hypothetical protein [unclassified Mesorhizobium]
MHLAIFAAQVQEEPVERHLQPRLEPEEPEVSPAAVVAAAERQSRVERLVQVGRAAAAL